MGIYRGWIDGLAAERGISGFIRGLIVSGGAIILGSFAAAAMAIPLNNEFPPGDIPQVALAIVSKFVLRGAFLFYPVYEVGRRKGIPLPWLWGAAAFLYGFPNTLNSALFVGVVGAWTPRAAAEEEAADTASAEEV